MRKKGVFICIEGLDGCGKTTQAKLLVKKLQNVGHRAMYTAEPSKGKIGKFIKKYCLHGGKRISTVVEALLFAADRYEHVTTEIIPALNEEKIVVSDRYVYSSLAYQGAAGINLDWIETINQHAIEPDLALFIDVEPKTVVQRLKPRKSVMENLETQRKVRKVYLKFVRKGALARVDGKGSKKEVASNILKVVLKSLKNS